MWSRTLLHGGEHFPTNMAAEISAAPPTLLLDSITPTSTGAFGLRKLRAAYAGNCIKVRRSSDNTTQDIGFSGNNLDTASMLTFCSTGDGFIDTWYDQSGNTKDMSQATTTKQPQIVSSGATIVTINSKPSALFTGATVAKYVVSAGLASDFFSTTAFTIMSLTRPTTGSGDDRGVISDSQQISNMVITQGFHTAAFHSYYQDAGSSNEETDVTGLSFPNIFVGMSRLRSGPNLAAYVNGTGSDSASVGAVVGFSRPLSIGTGYAATFDGTMTDVVFFNVALSNADVNTLGANMASWGGVTWSNI